MVILALVSYGSGPLSPPYWWGGFSIPTLTQLGSPTIGSECVFQMMHDVVLYRLGKARSFAAPEALFLIAQAPASMNSFVERFSRLV